MLNRFTEAKKERKNEIVAECCRDVTVNKIHGSVCTLVLGSQFSKISVHQKKNKSRK